MAAFVGSLCVLTAIVAFSVWKWGLRRPDRPTAQSMPEAADDLEPDARAEEALIVLDGATRVKRDKGAYGSLHVAYGLIEKYPATNSLQTISSHLKELGWKALE